MKPLNQIDLDMAAAHGCGNPDCDHKNHDGTIFLNANCHRNARLTARHGVMRDVVYFACAQCGKSIVGVQSAAPVHLLDLMPRCHPAGIDASYALRSGVLKIVCAMCHGLVADIPVIAS